MGQSDRIHNQPYGADYVQLNHSSPRRKFGAEGLVSGLNFEERTRLGNQEPLGCSIAESLAMEDYGGQVVFAEMNGCDSLFNVVDFPIAGRYEG